MSEGLPKFKLMFSKDDVWPPGTVRMARPLYGGDVASPDGQVRLPFVLRKELVEIDEHGSLVSIVEPAVERVPPQCVHFGQCGGCQYQMIATAEQLTVKRMVLRDLLDEGDGGRSLAEIHDLPAHAGEPYGYRNRIRLRVQRFEQALRFGYSVRGSAAFLPVTMCPIASSSLWDTAQGLLESATNDKDTSIWLDAANEVELFTDDAQARLQISFLALREHRCRRAALRA